MQKTGLTMLTTAIFLFFGISAYTYEDNKTDAVAQCIDSKTICQLPQD